jgi:hypothetical protein
MLGPKLIGHLHSAFSAGVASVCAIPAAAAINKPKRTTRDLRITLTFVEERKALLFST